MPSASSTTVVKTTSLPSASVAPGADRVASVDALRGLVITLMIFVNDVAGVKAAPGWLKHVNAKADAMTLPDIVFPAFLFIAGMSIPLAFTRAQTAGVSRANLFGKVLGRTFALLVMGVLMVSEENFNPWYRGAWGLLAYCAMILAFVVVPREPGITRTVLRIGRVVGGLAIVALALAYQNKKGEHLIFGPLFDPTGSRWFRHSWWGILGLIGWAYFVASTLYLFLWRRREWLIGATGLLMMLYVADNAQIAARIATRSWLAWASLPIAAAQGALGWIGSHVSIGEGLGSLAAVSMAGCCLGSILTPNSEIKTHGERLRWAALFALGLGLAGALLDPVYGINKIRATPAWCFYCAALTTGAWIFLYWLMDIRGRRRWSGLVRPAGANPLLAYVLSEALGPLAEFTGWPLDFYHNPNWPLAVNIGGSFIFALLIVQLTGLIVKTGYRMKA